MVFTSPIIMHIVSTIVRNQIFVAGIVVPRYPYFAKLGPYVMTRLDSGALTVDTCSFARQFDCDTLVLK